ncbi:MAG: preprotein translocase subunit YajC, partial [Thermodesulfobacteriota bacterium]|nr:preprotein translocase subunit YajC [Thermodesulfobacteriota bacterium]
MVSEAFAMAGGTAAQGQGGQYQGIIMLVAMFAIFYFLLIRPQQKRAKQQKELVGGLKAGDNVVSAGGIHGKIVS